MPLGVSHAHTFLHPNADDAEAPPADKSRFKFQKLLQPFALERGIATPIVWFLLDWLVLGVAIASLLVVEAWWVKVFASLVAALWIARLFVIGHDACHGSYTPNKILNKWIGRIAFLPSLTPYQPVGNRPQPRASRLHQSQGTRLRVDAVFAE